MRFVVVQETPDLWGVHDQVFDLPADYAKRSLTGLRREEAERLAAMANAEVQRWRPTSLPDTSSPDI